MIWLVSYLEQFQFMIIKYKEISHDVNQFYSGHNYLVISMSSQFPDAATFSVLDMDYHLNWLFLLSWSIT